MIKIGEKIIYRGRNEGRYVIIGDEGILLSKRTKEDDGHYAIEFNKYVSGHSCDMSGKPGHCLYIDSTLIKSLKEFKRQKEKNPPRKIKTIFISKEIYIHFKNITKRKDNFDPTFNFLLGGTHNSIKTYVRLHDKGGCEDLATISSKSIYDAMGKLYKLGYRPNGFGILRDYTTKGIDDGSSLSLARLKWSYDYPNSFCILGIENYPIYSIEIMAYGVIRKLKFKILKR